MRAPGHRGGARWHAAGACRRVAAVLGVLAIGALSGCAEPPPAQAPAAPAAPTTEMVRLDPPIGPGDEFDVIVHRVPDLNRSFRVPPSGIIFMPTVGEVNVRGMSANELRRDLTRALEPYLVNPQVSVQMTAYRSQKVVVLGEVARPGIFTLESPTGVLDAIALAGGFGRGANRQKIILLHQTPGNVTSEVLDLNQLLKTGEGVNPMLKAGDVVHVPPEMIVDIARYAYYVEQILRPALLVEQAILLGYDVRNAFEGRRTGTTNIVLPAFPTPP